MDQAVAFDGVDDYLVAANGPANRVGPTLSVAAWIRPDSIGASGNVIASTAATKSNNGWLLFVHRDGVGFSLLGSGTESMTGHPLPLGKWSHVVAVLDADGMMAYYVDGQLAYQGAQVLSAPVPDEDDALLIGANRPPNSTTTGSFFKGMIDDLRVYNTALTASEVKSVYDEAPVMQLRFDEARGATAFADGARDGVSGSCSGSACPAAGDAVQGQIGLAAQFDGIDDLVTLAADSRLDPASWSVGAWVKPAGSQPTPQRLVSKGSGTTLNYQLSIDPNSMAPRLETCGSYVTSTLQLAQGQWNQVLGTYDGSKLRLYINGSESNSKAVTGVCNASAAPSIGGDTAGNKLAGMLDEVVLYPSVLSAERVADLFDYQNGWVEDRASQSIVVDNDDPTAEVLLPSAVTYLPLQDTQVALAAADGTSGVASVALCQAGACLGPAAHCAEEQGIWCAPFKPTAEGSYSLTAQAVDGVGRTGPQSAARTVRVDNTPPKLVLNTTTGQRLDATRDPVDATGWRISLSGTAADPNYGSGVPADGVRVSVYNASGGLAGPERQVATLSPNGTWSLDYPLSESRPGGCYSIVVEASDALADTPGLTAAQIAQHRTVVTRSAGINSSAPSAQLERAWLSARTMISGTARLGGVATFRPVPVKLSWTTGAGGTAAALSLVCSAPGSPATYTPYNLTAGRLDAAQTYSWAGELQRDATCQVQITAPAGSQGVLSGAISVCGGQPKTWSDNGTGAQSIPFTASSTTCPADTCSGVPATAGVGGVDVAYTPLLPGSAFQEDAALTGEVLRLAFEESGDSSGPFRDVSGAVRDATCSGSACPSPGRPGHSGSALYLDGFDDYVSVPDGDAIDPAAAADFTVAVWVKPDALQPTATNTDSDIVEKWSQSGGYPYVIRYLNQKAGANEGKVDVARYDSSHAPSIRSTKRINDGRFHQVVFVKSGGTLKLFIDGVKDGETADSTTGNTTNTSALFIGQRGNGINRFAGLIDDVRIFDRGMAASEVTALYQGVDAVLELAFEDGRTTGGAKLADSSGWEHEAVLNTGTGDTANKAATGQVGNFALSFDGVDDEVNAGGSPDFKLTDRATIAAWIYPTANTSAPIISREGEYEIYRAADGQIRYAFANTTPGWTWVNPGVTAPLNTWTQIALVYDAGVVSTYLNGQLAHTATGAGSIGDIAPDQNDLLIGSRAVQPLEHFAGRMDDVRLYGRALLAEEIKQFYLAGWQKATLNADVGAVTSAVRWSSPAPAGLEGSYRIDLRSWDGLAKDPHVEMMPVAGTANRASPTWSTGVDTTAPARGPVPRRIGRRLHLHRARAGLQPRRIRLPVALRRRRRNRARLL